MQPQPPPWSRAAVTVGHRSGRTREDALGQGTVLSGLVQGAGCSLGLGSSSVH